MTAPTPEPALTRESAPTPEAIAVARSIKRTDHDARLQIAEALDDFAAEAVRRERKRLGNCPECGSTDFVIMDEGDYDRTCHDCRYVG